MEIVVFRRIYLLQLVQHSLDSGRALVEYIQFLKKPRLSDLI